ncbi:MAG: sensor histidine kinase [Armatimonadota bacterium]
MKITSVRVRLLLWNIAILALALLGAQLLIHVVIRTSLQANLDERLQRMVEGPRHFFSTNDPLQQEPRSNERTASPPPPSRNDGRGRDDWRRQRMMRVYGMDGAPLLPLGVTENAAVTPLDPSALAAAMTGNTLYSITRDSDGMLVRVLSHPVVKDGRQIGVIQVATSYEEMQTLLNSLTTMMLILIPCVLVVAGIGGIWLTDRALRPVRDIIHTAERLNPGDLSQRLPVMSTDEFGHLATTMNGMLARIETAFTSLRESYERERQFTADASHELRTPLTAITANATLALEGESTPAEYRASMTSIHQAATVMRQLVEDLLLLARADSKQLVPHAATVDVQDLFAGALVLLHRDATQASVTTMIDEAAPTLWGDAHQLQRVLTNLLDNAVRHTPADGQVTLAAEQEEGWVVLTVTDTGAGIAPEHLPHLGERFYRVDASRTRQHGGTGLGLAISTRIVEAHGGRLTIASTPGEGTCVRIVLPPAPHA